MRDNETFVLFIKLFYKSKISSKCNCLMVHSFKAILLESNIGDKISPRSTRGYNTLIACCVTQNDRIL